ncbi:SRPBCC domain-containing protein [Streptomyces sp. NPDC059072]|uniref:SRPBCC domain-containing protein n=1 Tax=Streptomyces sp. NPDC059072 TaxID=3346715 RepID=UPI00367ACA88
MEHQVFVPVPADDLRAALRDPARVARCVPGLQQDADTAAGPLAGRLRIRVDGHTVTYRGALTLTERDPDHFVLEGEGTEVRGSGTVKLTLDVTLTPEGEGTRLDFTAGAAADGRAAAFTPESTTAAVRRLLDRTATCLATPADLPPGSITADLDDTGVSDPVAEAEEAEAAFAAPDWPEPDLPGTADRAVPGPTDRPQPDAADRPEPGAADWAEPGAAEDGLPGAADWAERGVADRTEHGAAGAAADPAERGAAEPAEPAEPAAGEPAGEPVPLDPFLAGELDELDGAPRPPAEAAHARRTMIGRSAEEVDHAPPRGRYAPVPAPAATTAGAGLRWIAPAAALALASAVVLGRALRRRR